MVGRARRWLTRQSVFVFVPVNVFVFVFVFGEEYCHNTIVSILLRRRRLGERDAGQALFVFVPVNVFVSIFVFVFVFMFVFVFGEDTIVSRASFF